MCKTIYIPGDHVTQEVRKKSANDKDEGRGEYDMLLTRVIFPL